MTDISPLKKKIQSEEVLAQSSVSSGTANKLGASVNFALDSNLYHARWQLNGIYGSSTGSQLLVDGGMILPRNYTIVGFYMQIDAVGTGGTTQIDIRRQQASGSAGSSIFTIKPSMTTAAGNLSKLYVKFNPSSTVHNPTGSTVPTLAINNLDDGDSLFLDFVTRQSGADSLTVTLILNPR